MTRLFGYRRRNELREFKIIDGGWNRVKELILCMVGYYLAVGAVLAIWFMVADPGNARRRVTDAKRPMIRFLIITSTWIFKWERKKKVRIYTNEGVNHVCL